MPEFRHLRPLAGGFDSYKVLGDDAELEDGYQSFLPGRCVGELVDSSTALRSLRADSVFEIENVFRQTSGDADASCTVSANGLNRRFACRDALVGAGRVTEDRATTDAYFGALLTCAGTVGMTAPVAELGIHIGFPGRWPWLSLSRRHGVTPSLTGYLEP